MELPVYLDQEQPAVLCRERHGRSDLHADRTPMPSLLHRLPTTGEAPKDLSDGPT